MVHQTSGVHQTVTGAQAGALSKLVAFGKNSGRHDYNSPDYLVCTGLSGVPATRPANDRPRDQWVTRASTNSHTVAPDCPVCHGGSWLMVGFARRGRKSRIVRCLMVHRTFRCAHGQKATSAFQMELKRLLVALGL